jgi:hypothetical protein
MGLDLHLGKVWFLIFFFIHFRQCSSNSINSIMFRQTQPNAVKFRLQVWDGRIFAPEIIPT